MKLARNALSTVDAVAMAVAVLSPAGAMAYNTTGAAIFGRSSTPLAFLLAGIACLSLAFVIVCLTRSMASAGYLYSYSRQLLGRSSGFMVGWLYLFGFFSFVTMTATGVGGFGREFLRVHLGIGVPNWFWFALFLVCLILALALNVFHVKINSRTLLTVSSITIVIVLVVDILITLKGGKSGHTWAPFTLSSTGGASGLFYATLFGVLSYIGFETGSVLAEETREATRAIPTSVVLAVTFSVVFYVWTTYSIAIGVGTGENDVEAWAANPRILSTLAERFGGWPLGLLVDLAAIISGFAVCVACVSSTARTVFAMGRDKALPSWFGCTHSRYKTPVNSTILIGVLATLIGALIAFCSNNNSGPFTLYYFLGAVGALSVGIIYALACILGIVWLWNTKTQASRYLAFFPVIGLLVFVLAIYGSIYPGDWPPFPYRLAPYVVIVWLLCGILVWRRLESKTGGLPK